MEKYEEKTTKSVCRLPAQNTSTTKLENTSTTKGKGLGENVLAAVTRSISEIFAGARIPCTWPCHIPYHSREPPENSAAASFSNITVSARIPYRLAITNS